MKTAERIVLVALLICMIAGGVWFYVTLQYNHEEKLAGVARGDFEIRREPNPPETAAGTIVIDETDTKPISIAGVSVRASVADTLPERIAGLSNTVSLPEGVVKLFVFGAAGNHSIWMKDMYYPLDILWVRNDGTIAHIAENISPDTYPESFSSPEPVWYVIEANAGFVAANQITVGDEVIFDIAE